MSERDEEWDWEWDPEDYDTNQAFYEFSGPEEDELENQEQEHERDCRCIMGCGSGCKCDVECDCRVDGCECTDGKYLRDSFEFLDNKSEPEEIQKLTELQVVFSWRAKTMLTQQVAEGFNDVRDNLVGFISPGAYDIWIFTMSDHNTLNPDTSGNFSYEPFETELRNLFANVFVVEVQFGSPVSREKAYAVAFDSLESSRDNFRTLSSVAEEYGLSSLTRFVNFSQILVPVLAVTEPLFVGTTD